MSWKLVIANDSGVFVPNGLRFATLEEAEAYARARLTSVREWRVIVSSDPVNYRVVEEP